MKKGQLKELLASYGQLALVVYLTIFFLVWGGFAVAIALGFKTDSSMGKAGILGAAWVATKLTQPFRIMGTVALTPIVAQLMKRYGRKSKKAPAAGEATPEKGSASTAEG